MIRLFIASINKKSNFESGATNKILFNFSLSASLKFWLVLRNIILPKLITIRGGLQELESVHFKDWLYDLTVGSNPHFAHYEQSHLAQFIIPESLPLFSGEGNDLEHAIKLADKKINAPKIFRRFL